MYLGDERRISTLLAIYVLPLLAYMYMHVLVVFCGVLFFLSETVSGVGSSPALATCETSQVLLMGMSGVFFSGFSCFRPTY